MSSLKFYTNDLKRRLLFEKYNYKYRFVKSLCYNSIMPFNLKIYFFNHLHSSYLNKLKNRIRNRCVYTYRSRSVLRQFKLARSKLRENIWKLLIPGVFYASW